MSAVSAATTTVWPEELATKVFNPPSAVNPARHRRRARRSRHELDDKRTHVCAIGG
jgi:hypothetical protein